MSKRQLTALQTKHVAKSNTPGQKAMPQTFAGNYAGGVHIVSFEETAALGLSTQVYGQY